MKKNFLLALFLIIQLLANAAIAGQDATGDANTFQIKLPDGLYLYQPKVNWGSSFTPLLIINKGRFMDPNLLIKRIGLKQFEKIYLDGRQFNVYVGKEHMGVIHDIRREYANTRCEETDEFLSFYIFKGTYEGYPLPVISENSWPINSAKLAAKKAIAAPSVIGLPLEKDKFVVTEDDRTLAVATIKKELDQLAIKRIEQFYYKLYQKKEKMVIDDEALESVIALDIDNNGKKDLFGIYTVNGINAEKKRSGGRGFSVILFVIWDTGRAEVVMSTENSAPAFSLGGIIDIDKDGVQELIVQKSVSTNEEPYAVGTEINILRHDPSGWKRIYRSAPFCADALH